eukprot:2204791-Rhodomonas_salina.2
MTVPPCVRAAPFCDCSAVTNSQSLWAGGTGGATGIRYRCRQSNWFRLVKSSFRRKRVGIRE